MNRAVFQRLTFCRGFTLVELALVLVIVAVLIGGLLIPLSTQMDMRSVTSAQETLTSIQEALIGYAASHTAADGRPYLPCPDTNDDGVENRLGTACAAPEGRIPWVDLGLGERDPWNNRYRYRVTPAFSDRGTGFTLTMPGTLQVCTNSTCAANIANFLPAIIVSHGKNGAGAFNSTGGANPNPTGANELENADYDPPTNDDNNFVSPIPGPDFDDIVVWLPTGILVSRMIAAGRLP